MIEEMLTKPTVIDGVLVLPRWTMLRPEPRTPHRRRILAQCTIGRDSFWVCSNHKRTLFWVHASGDGFAGDGCSKISQTCATKDASRAETWREYVNAKNVRVSERNASAPTVERLTAIPEQEKGK